jgi:hypothetical protein
VIFVLFVFLFVIIWPQPTSAQEVSPTPELSTLAPMETGRPETATPFPLGISYPQKDAALKGVVTIIGTTEFPGQTGWDISFGFSSNPTGAWFPLSQGVDVFSNGPLATWDTVPLTDGDYSLRLRVFLADANQEFIVPVRVRNYSPLESPSPTITFTPLASSTPTITFTPTETFTLTPGPSATKTPLPPAPTTLPPNPAALGVNAILFNLGRGAFFIFLLFGLFGALLRLRRRI